MEVSQPGNLHYCFEKMDYCLRKLTHVSNRKTLELSGNSRVFLLETAFHINGMLNQDGRWGGWIVKRRVSLLGSNSAAAYVRRP